MSQLESERRDGRAASTLRPLSCELSTLKAADGSALWKSGATQVLATVHGPAAPRMLHHEQGDKAIVTVYIKSGVASNTYEREWETILTEILSACILVNEYPRSVIQVVLQIIAVDGSVLSACLHAAISACVDATIAMKFLPVAATCLVDPEGSIQLDPSASEEENKATVVLVVNEDKLLASHTMNLKTSMDVLLQCLAAAQRMAPAVTSFWRLAVEQKTTRETQTLWSS